MAGKGQGGSTNANHQKILLHLLNSVDENKYCCDCDAKGPRWASWNLGLFICIRCAGIHRNLGVHISKVKSVNLDSWTSEQISSVIRMGNKKAREIYEAQLPPGHRRPQEDYALEQFIRNKYDKKMYADGKLLKENTFFEKIDIEKYLAKINGARTRPPAKGTGQIAAPPSSNRPQSTEGNKQQPKEQPNSTNAPNKSSASSAPVAPQPVANVDELLNFGTSNTPSTPITSAGAADTGQAPTQNGNIASLSTPHATCAAVSSASQGNSLSSDLAGLVFESAPQPNSGGSGVSGSDLFGNSAGDMFGSPPFNNNNNSGLATVNTDDKSKSSGKKSNQDILSLYGSSNATPAFNSNLGAATTGNGMNMNMNNSPFTAPPPTCGPGVAPSSYQWNQPINSLTSLQMQSRKGVILGEAGVEMGSPFQQSNAFTAPNSNSSNMYSQNNLANQFGNLSFSTPPAVAATMAAPAGHHQGTNSFAPLANGNPFAPTIPSGVNGAHMVNSTSGFGPSNPSQPANSNPYSNHPQQINWQQPITSSYNYNNFTSNQNSMPQMYNNGAPLSSQNKMFAPTMQNQQQQQFAQNFNHFQSSPFAGSNVTNQQQFNSQMMSSSLFASPNAQQSTGGFGGYNNVQNQQQSLWLN